MELDKIGNMTQGDLRRFIVNLLLSDPGALPPPPKGDPTLGRYLGRLTASPTVAENLDVFDLLVDATNGIVWRFIYRAASASVSKWEFLGGAPLFAEIVTNENLNNAGYVDLATVGPSVVLPNAGDYDVETGFNMNNAVNGVLSYMSYNIGATGAVDADSVTSFADTFGTSNQTVMRCRRKTGLAAVTLTAKYKNTGSGWFGSRWMRVSPIRIT